MDRFALEKLKQWKEKKNRKPLIIRGARQVGKTWLMKEFGRTCFKKVAYVNFDSNARMRQVFEGDINIERLILAISAETGVSIDSQDTLLLFDEVQEVPKALTALKFFCEEAPEYAIVAAGSLLGVAMHKGTSFPVGKVDFMDLYPLSFREFLRALGEKRFVEILDSSDTDMVTMFKSKYMDRLREYYYVGGMPEVVQSYVDSKDFNQVREIQKNLLNYYQQDFSKHAEPALVPRLNLVWNSIPMQLAKKNKKYIYEQVREGARAKDFELAIQWLMDCGLIHKVQRIKKPGLPLKAYLDLDAFKIYLLDIGLLMAMVDLGVEAYYYSAEKSSGEIDFLLQGRSSILPVEVKAEENLRAKSLKAFCEKYHPAYAVRTSMSDYREQDWMTNIPLYNICRIKKYLEQ